MSAEVQQPEIAVAGAREETSLEQSFSLMRWTLRVCLFVIIGSVLACIALAASRSSGLTAVAVSAIDSESEPRDHNIPFVKQHDALPDYKIIVLLESGRSINLGTRPNTSAVNGLTWRPAKPIAVSIISGVRLLDDDKLVSDVIAEVPLKTDKATSGNYRFKFTTAYSFSAGIDAFFQTGIGKAIATAFTIAILVLILIAVVWVMSIF